MSRIGKKIIPLPDKVKVSVLGSDLDVTGPLGTLHVAIPSQLSVEIGDKVVSVKRASDERNVRALHGMCRSLINNMVIGVSHGYTKILDIVGVGYKAEIKGKNIELALGFSHQIIFPIPEGIKVTVDKQTRVTINGIDKAMVGETSARIRRLRPPEPYKGKGVRYSDEIVKKKVGKAAGAVGGAAK